MTIESIRCKLAFIYEDKEMPKKIPPFKRLYSNTRKTSSGCIEWLGQKSSSGYGQIKAFNKMVGCHRLSYELYNGAIPFGLEIMHSCDNKICVNPDHLIAGTHKRNMSDASDRGLMRRGIKNSQSKQVMVLGICYGSVKEAERAIGVGSGTVLYWIRNKPDKAKYISRKKYNEAQNVK